MIHYTSTKEIAIILKERSGDMNGCETLGNLWDHWNECGKNVPETHGIYKIILPAEMELRFVERIEGHPAADTYDVETLTDKYKQSGYSKLLYVGKAGGRRGLRQRIRQYLLYGFGGGNDHRGGRAIFQIEGFRELVCEWEEIEDCKAAEHRLLEAFNAKYSVYPVANWQG